jgi:hypothetical protein
MLSGTTRRGEPYQPAPSKISRAKVLTPTHSASCLCQVLVDGFDADLACATRHHCRADGAEQAALRRPFHQA